VLPIFLSQCTAVMSENLRGLSDASRYSPFLDREMRAVTRAYFFKPCVWCDSAIFRLKTNNFISVCHKIYPTLNRMLVRFFSGIQMWLC